MEAPRLVIAGLAGDTGKSLISLGFAAALRRRGLVVAPFKKGPDFIDAAWLGAAAGAPGRNLDTWLMPAEAILGSLRRAAAGADVAVIEGNRGLFDGMDAEGTHSTAALARLIDAPVVLVVDATKSTRTVAALVAGCAAFEPGLRLAGVVLNRVGTLRQEAVIRQAISRTTDIPVLGAVPRLPGADLPSRHLGLVTAAEHPDAQAALGAAADAVERFLDVEATLGIARSAAPLAAGDATPARRAPTRARIGVLRDRAFSFYYPENLEALEAAGAELVETSPLDDDRLPEVDAVYAGGGFPEVHAAGLAANGSFREDLRRRIAAGLPVWAECGGLMYLAETLAVDGRIHPMVGALPVVAEQTERPQGHGYVAARVDGDNPFLARGTELRGHEFHYSRVTGGAGGLPTVLALARGVGAAAGRDGLHLGSAVATYTHLHAAGTPGWAEGLVRAAAGGAP